MDSAPPTLLSRAHQGQPLALATLVQQALESDDIDVTAWKRQGLLHLDLMSFERLLKSDMLPTIRNTLVEVCPEEIRGIKISSYIYGEDMPCWMERWGPLQSLDWQMEGISPAKSLTARLEECLKNVVQGRDRRGLATGTLATMAIVATALSISLGSQATLSFFAQPEEASNEPVKTRRNSSTATPDSTKFLTPDSSTTP